MKKVDRYKCDFCNKIAARPETILKHEAECLKNPDGKNCYMCEMAYQGDYEIFHDYNETYSTVKDQCICAYTDEVVSSVLGLSLIHILPSISYEDCKRKGENIMNRQRRKRLTEAFEKVAEAMEILEEVKSEEEESYDNLPDNFRDGDRGEEMQNYIEMLDEAYGYLDDANSVIEQI